MNKFCVYCGQELDNGSKFCHNCGAEVADVNDTSKNSVDFNHTNNSVSEKFTIENFESKKKKDVNQIAIIGFVSSILSYFICCGLFSLPSLIFSIIGLSRSKKIGGEGKVMAIIGIILSAIPLVLFILNILLNFVAIEDDSIYNADIMMRLFSL